MIYQNHIITWTHLVFEMVWSNFCRFWKLFQNYIKILPDIIKTMFLLKHLSNLESYFFEVYCDPGGGTIRFFFLSKSWSDYKWRGNVPKVDLNVWRPGASRRALSEVYVQEEHIERFCKWHLDIILSQEHTERMNKFIETRLTFFGEYSLNVILP